MPLGQLPLYALKRNSAVFDPASLNLAGWWRAPYSVIPWAGTASAGGSGSVSLVAGINDPSVGTALGGFNTADFNGGTSYTQSSNTISTDLPNSGYFYWFLFNIEAVAAVNSPIASAWNNVGIWNDNTGNIGLSLRNDSGTYYIQAWQYFSAGGQAQGSETQISLNTWNLACVRYTGTEIRLKINSESIIANTTANYSTSGIFRCGGNYSQTRFYDGLIADIGLLPSAADDNLFDDIGSYVNDRYSLSL